MPNKYNSKLNTPLHDLCHRTQLLLTNMEKCMEYLNKEGLLSIKSQMICCYRQAKAIAQDIDDMVKEYEWRKK